MIWLAWRQMRAQTAVVAGALVVVVAMLVATRPHVVDAYGPSGTGDLTGFYVWLRLLGTLLIGIPAGLGAFWGAPLVAGELEAGTHRLVWTQSITRDRWLSTKLIAVAFGASVLVAVLAIAFTWWCEPIDATAASRIGPANFAQRGVAPIGYTIFALALGVLLGAVLRRTLPAMAATLAGFFIVRIAVQKLVRPYLTATSTVPTDSFGPGPRGGWALSTHTVDPGGHLISGEALEHQLVAACHITRATPDVDQALAQCAHRLGYQNLTETVPARSFWQLQVTEVALFLVLAAIIAALAFWWVRHRTS